MSYTNWQDPGTTEVLSTQISGLQEAVGKIERSIGVESLSEIGIQLSEVFIATDDRYRIYQAPSGKRNWVSSPAPIIYKNGNVASDNYDIDYGGGSVIFRTPILSTDVITASATHITALTKSIEDSLSTHSLDIAQNAYKIIQSPDNKYNSWPAVVKAASGDVLVFYSKGNQHLTADLTRNVMCRKSSDYGLTWSDEVVIYSNSSYDNALFSACISASNTIILLIRQTNLSSSISDLTVNTICIRSTDNGTTWGTPFVVSGFSGTNITLIGPGTAIPSKGVMASYHYGNTGNWECGIFWSTDDGLTWGSKQIVASGTDSNNVPVECRFAYIGSGKIFGIGRNQNDTGLFQLQSEDYGSTWTIAKTNITDQLITPSGLIYKDGEIDVVYYHRGTGALRQRHASITDIWSKPLYWSDSKVINYGSLAAGDAGYPSTTNLINDTCLCVYYSGKGSPDGLGPGIGTGIYGILYSFKNNLNYQTPKTTTSSITYYVDVTNGSDANDGLTSGTAFRTINKAKSMIPSVLNHDAAISCAAGDYTAEGIIVIQGLSGHRNFTFTAVNAVITSLAILRCTIPVTINSITVTQGSNASIAVSGCADVSLNGCNLSSTPQTATDGIFIIKSIATVSGCIISNRATGIHASSATVFSDSNSGSNNSYGLYAEKAATIGKNGTQPSATTAEAYATGGAIR